MYKNQEGYSDPTAGAVMKKLMTEYNRKKRADRRKAQRKKNRQQRMTQMEDSQNRPIPNDPKEADKNDS